MPNKIQYINLARQEFSIFSVSGGAFATVVEPIPQTLARIHDCVG